MLLDGNVVFVKGCLLVHALPVVALVGDLISDGDAIVESAEDTENGAKVVAASLVVSDVDEDSVADGVLETGGTVR